ncbi:MAG: hypothetical protein KAV87_13010 [Desulfobacteraceae bacterium]|nr:hypothetical protein [Desulfobacteraceae bacterium]
MATDVSVFSQALVRLGDNPVSGLSELSPGFADLFPQVKANVETSHPWRFNTIKSQLLTRTLTQPPSQYKYVYQLPPDMLNGQPRTVWNSPFNQGRSSQFTNFNIFEDKLLTSAEQVLIDYQVPKVVDVFPIHVTELMIRALMAVIALPVTDQQNTADSALIAAWGKDGNGGYSREARRIDSQGHPPQGIKNYPLVTVRHGGG